MISKLKSLLTIALSIFFAMALSGCPGSSDDDNPPNGGGGDVGDGTNSESNSVPAETASGYVVDGYIRNAFVCLDINNNDECDDDEPYSKSSGDGSYSLDVSDLSDAQKGGAQLITIGGTDNDSGYRFTGLLQAPLYTDASGNIHITPITTLLAAQVAANTADAIDQPVADLQAQLALQVDPRTDPATNNDLQKVAIQVQKSLELIAAALQVQQFGLPDEEAMDAAMQALADDLAAAAATSSGGSSIRTNSILPMATSNASAVDLPQLVGEIDKVTLADGTEITVPDNISSSAEAMAQEIDSEFDNATDTSDVNNIVYAVAVTVEELKDKIANTDSADLAKLDLETAIDIEDGYRVEIDRILSLIAYEPESNDDTSMFDYLVNKDSSNDITGSTTVAQFNDLLDDWLAAGSFTDGELDKLAELQQLALAVELQESADSSSGLELTNFLGDDKGFYMLHELRAYSTVEMETLSLPYDTGSSTSGSFASTSLGFNTGTQKFDIIPDGDDSSETLYVWGGSSWHKTNNNFHYIISDDSTVLTLGYRDSDDAFIIQETAVLSAAEDLKDATHIFRVDGGDGYLIQQDFTKGQMYVFEVQPVPEAIEFRDWRIDSHDDSAYPTLDEFIDDCVNGNFASDNKEQCVIFWGYEDKDGGDVNYRLGFDNGRIVHASDESGEDLEIKDYQAGTYQLEQLSNGDDIIRVSNLKPDYIDIYGGLEDVVDGSGERIVVVLYGSKAIAGMEREWQQSRQEVFYDKDAYDDFVEGSGDKLKDIVDDLQ